MSKAITLSPSSFQPPNNIKNKILNELHHNKTHQMKTDAKYYVLPRFKTSHLPTPTELTCKYLHNPMEKIRTQIQLSSKSCLPIFWEFWIFFSITLRKKKTVMMKTKMKTRMMMILEVAERKPSLMILPNVRYLLPPEIAQPTSRNYLEFLDNLLRSTVLYIFSKPFTS